MDLSVLSIKDKKIKRLVNTNLLISFIVCIIGIIIMWIYNIYYISFYLLPISIAIFKNGILIGVFSYICGKAFEFILSFG